ncbi:Arylsulfatase [Pontiella desulfatans]|uniref:Arylsulfatase n=1 Tax=Pontiella desulfatans TaxID=2750659 RepID=A0A6C2TZ83_PONDE|nr:sulfatase [Pontiella desulfatans]SPS73688.1 sulfatase S1_16 [Kiritimatiellales bacterium]VGO12671.1 Arylsulfatase [Pontiella desulfatans]
MSKWIIVGGLAALLCGFVHAAEKPMNVIFILADDLGWSDTTLYGTTSLYKTPNIERLAKRGMTFTRAYSNSPLCSPTRASILTGQTPARHGSTAPQHHHGEVRLKAGVEPSTSPGNKALGTVSVTRLDTKLPTLGKLIKGDGYATAHFGKWHLGPEPYSPLQHGFDIDIPHWYGPGPAGSFLAPWQYPNFKANHPKEHIEDRMAEEAVAWMTSVNMEQPFFMNYWQFSVHAPFDAKEELIEKYRNEIDPKDPQRCPIYAAMVHSLDDAVGSLLDAVDAAGIADETVIVFISDNGGNMYDDVNGTTATSNFPLRGGKATMFEGGIRVPCVVIWPGVTQPGSRSDELIQTADFYPTLLNGLGIDLPENWPLDGVDLLPALKGGRLSRDAIFTYFPHSPPIPEWLPPSMTVHVGDWKLIRLFCQGENGAHDWLLYNLKDDIGEKNNLAAAYPERVQQMDRMIEDYIKTSGAVVPQPNTAFDPKFYMPENIGVPKDKQAVRGLVAGWVENGTCSLEQGEGTLVVKSTGADPFVQGHQFKLLHGGPFVVHFSMKSNSQGTGAVYYNQPAGKDCLIDFPVTHDGRFHELAIKLPVKTLNALRIDPSRGPGTMEFDWIRVLDHSGKILQRWEF